MASTSRLSRLGDARYLLALLQPFVLLWWLVPWLSGRTIGNDYPVYAIEYQLELLFSLHHGSYPLFVPGFHHGQSAAALSLGGLHHPIAWICGILPGYWDGHALAWNTLFRLVSLGFAQLFLWRLLRGLRLPLWLAWLVSTVAVYNLRMLDMFRFAATLEAWTGAWFVVSAAGWMLLDRRSRLAPLALVLAGWWTIGSGHPQFAYFAAMAAGITVLALPLLLPSDLREAWPTVGSYYGRVAAWGSLSVALSASLLLPFVLDFMAGNTGRVGREYAWSLGYSDTPAGVVANLLMPLRADVHGAFGGSSLLLLALLLPLGRLAGLRIARSAWIGLGLAALVLLYTLGGHTPLHRWAWEIVPFAQAFRVPGRLAQLLPFLALILAVLAWRAWEADEGAGRGARRGLALVAGIALLAQLASPWIWSAWAPRHTLVTAQQLRGVGWGLELAVAFAGALALAALAGLVLRPGWRWLVAPLLLATLAQLGICLSLGTWVEPARPTVSLAQKAERKQAALKYYYGRHGQGDGMEQGVVRDHGRLGAPFHAELARLCSSPVGVQSREQAYERLLAQAPPAGSCLIEGAQSAPPGPAAGRVDLSLATFNRQDFEVVAPREAWLVVHHPHDGRWRARVDGVEVPLARADGLELAVPIPPGEHGVQLRYGSPAWTAGAIISSAALALLGMLASLRLLSGGRRAWGGAVSVVVAVGVFALWYTSLYSGEHLGTVYSWQDGEVRQPILRPELVPEDQQCRTPEGLQVPCSY
jgi:hypothetical protein